MRRAEIQGSRPLHPSTTSSASSTAVPAAKRQHPRQTQNVGADAAAATNADPIGSGPPERGNVGLQISSPCDWIGCPSQDRSSPVETQAL